VISGGWGKGRVGALRLRCGLHDESLVVLELLNPVLCWGPEATPVPTATSPTPPA
jgi:hypothetical protein